MEDNKKKYTEEELVITLVKTRCNVQKFLVTSTVDDLSVVVFLCDQWGYLMLIPFSENGNPLENPMDYMYHDGLSTNPGTVRERFAEQQRMYICRLINMRDDVTRARVIYRSVTGRPADSNADTNCPGPIWYDVILTRDPLEAANLSATACTVKSAARFLDDFVEDRLVNI